MAADLEVLAPAPPVLPPALPIAPKPRFGAGLALASFGMLVGGQFLTGVFVLTQAMLVWFARGKDPSSAAQMKLLIDQAIVPTLLAAATVSMVTGFVVARLWAWDLVFDRSPEGIGLVRASWRTVAVAAFIGAVASVLYLSSTILVPFDSSKPLGPLAQAAADGGLTRATWAVLALLFAPLFEEFFFRGLLLSGFTASWGRIAGPIVTAVLFVSLHLFEAWSYWPAVVAITLLSAATFLARKVTGSLMPAMAMHFAYNAVIVVTVYVRM
jgi:uncharacterized protein